MMASDKIKDKKTYKQRCIPESIMLEINHATSNWPYHSSMEKLVAVTKGTTTLPASILSRD